MDALGIPTLNAETVKLVAPDAASAVSTASFSTFTLLLAKMSRMIGNTDSVLAPAELSALRQNSLPSYVWNIVPIFIASVAPDTLKLVAPFGADAVMVNTAIAASRDPVAMSHAFKLAQEAGRTAFEAGLAVKAQSAVATSPMEAFLKEAMK